MEEIKRTDTERVDKLQTEALKKMKEADNIISKEAFKLLMQNFQVLRVNNVTHG